MLTLPYQYRKLLILSTKRSRRAPKFRSVISWSAESFVCYFRSLYKDAVCGRSSILLEALIQKAKRRKNPFIIHEATVQLKSISLTQEQSVFLWHNLFNK